MMAIRAQAQCSVLTRKKWLVQKVTHSPSSLLILNLLLLLLGRRKEEEEETGGRWWRRGGFFSCVTSRGSWPHVSVIDQASVKEVLLFFSSCWLPLLETRSTTIIFYSVSKCVFRMTNSAKPTTNYHLAFAVGSKAVVVVVWHLHFRHQPLIK